MKVARNESANCLSVVLLVLGLAALAIYLASRPIQGWVVSEIRSVTTWTPERIAADPSGYVAWAARELNRLEQLRVAEVIRLRARSTEVARRLATMRETLQLQESDLRAFADTFRRADAAGGWPVLFRNRPWQRAEMQDELLRLDTLVQANREMLLELEKARGAIPILLARIEQEAAEISGLKIRIQTARDILDISTLGESYNAIREQTDRISAYASALQSVTTLPSPETSDVRAEVTQRESRLQAILEK